MNRGPPGERLPAGVVIFRLFKSNNGTVPPEAFHLSDKDKLEVRPRLSCWVKELCTPEQADVITKALYSYAAYLPIDRVREIRPDPDEARLEDLDVEWEEAIEQAGGQEVICTKPGAEGHCGITGLNQGGDGKLAKAKRKSIYGQLARLANSTKVEPIRRPN